MLPARAVFSKEISGVMPLPPPKSTRSAARSPRQKRPAGRITSRRSPSRTDSFIQLETRPPATRFTVTFQPPSTSGALQSE